MSYKIVTNAIYIETKISIPDKYRLENYNTFRRLSTFIKIKTGKFILRDFSAYRDCFIMKKIYTKCIKRG